jgi:hypothetical protein
MKVRSIIGSVFLGILWAVSVVQAAQAGGDNWGG